MFGYLISNFLFNESLWSMIRMSLNKINRLSWCSGLFLLLLLGQASAEISRAKAEYLYGPETAEAEACKLAIGKAKTKALANVLGESVSAEELLSCRGSTGKISDYGCDLNQVTWSQIDGDIKKTLSENVITEKREGASACVAEVEIDVVIPKDKPDPNFQLRADFKQTVFRVGDDFNLDIELSQAGYFAVFNWLPHDSNSVVRIIPAIEDPSQSNVFLSLDKTKSLKVAFSMTASWADSYTGKRKFYDEYLLVVATKRPYKWLSKYSLDEFKSLLQLIPITDKRLVKKAYQLTKN
jgi:hypothetical protein